MHRILASINNKLLGGFRVGCGGCRQLSTSVIIIVASSWQLLLGNFVDVILKITVNDSSFHALWRKPI